MASSSRLTQNDRPPHAGIRAGVHALDAYLARRGIARTAWCEQHGLEPSQLWRIANGETGSVGGISLDLAVAIERATDGEVHHLTWAAPTRRKRTRRRAA